MNKDLYAELSRQEVQKQLGNKIKQHETLVFDFIPDWDNTDEVAVCIDDGKSRRMMTLHDDEILLAIKLLELCKERFDKNFSK